ncbi:MAG: hypothetical protein ACI4PU_05980 [Intestinibacter sp.]
MLTFTDEEKQKWIAEINQEPDDTELLLIKKAYYSEEKLKLESRLNWIKSIIGSFYVVYLGILAYNYAIVQLQQGIDVVDAADTLAKMLWYGLVVLLVYAFEVFYSSYIRRKIQKLEHALNIIEIKLARLK